MKPIYCPACGVKMKLEIWEIGPWQAWYQCACGVHNASVGADTHRGAAIRAGRAMRAIIDMIETRQAVRENASFAHGMRVGRRDMARAALMLLRDNKLTRRQITERMRQEANQ